MTIDFDKPITRADVVSKGTYMAQECVMYSYSSGGHYLVRADGTAVSVMLNKEWERSGVRFKNAPEITHRFRNVYEGDSYRSGPWQEKQSDAKGGMSSSDDYLYTIKETYEDGVRVKVEIVTL